MTKSFSNITSNAKSLIKSFLSLFFPLLCPACGEPLVKHEDAVCLACFLSLPKTNSHLNTENRAVIRFYGKVRIERAASFLYYNKGGVAQKIVYGIKYDRNFSLGRKMGKIMAEEILLSDFFENIDYVIPVPLHKRKFKTRGFNQSFALAKGINDITRIPIDHKSLIRKKFNSTQTNKGLYERWTNTKNRFKLIDNDLFRNKHVLLIDDVLTTGSTLEACAQCFKNIEGIKISILTLAVT